MAIRLSALLTDRALLLRNIIFLLLVLSLPRLLRLEEVSELKKSIYFIGTRTRNLPDCSIVP
jgi:hypothetical protein